MVLRCFNRLFENGKNAGGAIPAKSGIYMYLQINELKYWIPAFAGMTVRYSFVF